MSVSIYVSVTVSACPCRAVVQIKTGIGCSGNVLCLREILAILQSTDGATYPREYGGGKSVSLPVKVAL